MLNVHHVDNHEIIGFLYAIIYDSKGKYRMSP